MRECEERSKPLKEEEIVRRSNATKENVEDNYLIAMHSNDQESKNEENCTGSHGARNSQGSVFSVFPRSRYKEHAHTMVTKVKKDEVEKVSRLIRASQRVMEITREREFRAELPPVQYEELLQIVNGAMYLFGCLPGAAVLEQLSSNVLCTLVTLYARCKEVASSDTAKPKEQQSHKNKEAKWDKESHNILSSYFCQLFMSKEVDEETKNAYDKLCASMLETVIGTTLENDKEILNLLAQEVKRRLRRCTLVKEMQHDNVNFTSQHESNNTGNDDVYSTVENAKLNLLSLRDRKAVMLTRNYNREKHGTEVNNNKNDREFEESTLLQSVNLQDDSKREEWEEEQQFYEFTLAEIDEMYSSFAFLRYRNKELWIMMRDVTCAHIHHFAAKSTQNVHEKGNKRNVYNVKCDNNEDINTYIQEEIMMRCIRHILYAFDFVGESGCYERVMKELVNAGLIDHAIEPPSVTTRVMREMCYNSYKEQTLGNRAKQLHEQTQQCVDAGKMMRNRIEVSTT